MLKIDVDQLNKLEKEMHQKINDVMTQFPALRIVKAAEICGVSVSKVSKFVKKLGFANYKQYIDFMTNKTIVIKEPSNELLRIKQFIEHFNTELVDQFVSLLTQYEKIILFGYGPSLICAQYFEYKLRLTVSKTAIALSDEISLEKLIDNKTVVIVLSTTGQFTSFDNIFARVDEAGAKGVLLLEEYNTTIALKNSSVYFLTNAHQKKELLPYEKTRTVFFIFIEEVMQSLRDDHE